MPEKKRPQKKGREINLADVEERFDNPDALASAINSALQDADDAISTKRKIKVESGEPETAQEEEISFDDEDIIEEEKPQDSSPDVDDDLIASAKEAVQEKPTQKKPTQKKQAQEKAMGLAELDEQPEEDENEEKESTKATVKEKEYYERLLRVSAEFENFKKRTTKEKQDFSRFAGEDVFVQLLPVMDNFDRAIEHVKDSKDINALLDGVKMIRRQMREILTKNGVHAIESMGKPFDPNKHQAVQMVETEKASPNTIIQEFQKGFFYHEKLIRPAMVVVAQEGSAPVEENVEELEPIEEGKDDVLEELAPFDDE